MEEKQWRHHYFRNMVSFLNPAFGGDLELAKNPLGIFTPGYISAAAAKSLQSCPTLCDPIDGSPPGSPVPGILYGTLEWVAISFSNAGKWKVKVKSLSRVQLFATPWIAAYQAPLSMGFSRQEYWSGVPSPSLGIFLGLCKSGWCYVMLYHLWLGIWTAVQSETRTTSWVDVSSGSETRLESSSRQSHVLFDAVTQACCISFMKIFLNEWNWCQISMSEWGEESGIYISGHTYS